jgi:hypothetical protein
MWSLIFSFSNQNTVCVSHMSRAYYMSSPSHPSWFDHPNNIACFHFSSVSVFLAEREPLVSLHPCTRDILWKQVKSRTMYWADQLQSDLVKSGLNIFWNRNFTPSSVFSVVTYRGLDIYYSHHRQLHIGIMTRLPAGRSAFNSRQGLGFYLLATASRPALEPTQPPMQWVPVVLLLG